MGKFVRAIMVAVLLAVAMLSSAATASADSKPGMSGKNPSADSKPDMSGKNPPARTSSITWE